MRGTGAGFDRKPWVENLFRPLVVMVMVGCIVWSMVQLLLRFTPSWNPTYLVVGCMLVTLEAFYSHRLLRSQRALGTNIINFRIVELLSIFILLKLGRYFTMSVGDVATEIQTWPQDPLRVFDMETLSAFALAVLCWMVVTDTARDLDSIGERPERRGEPVSPVERITFRFFVGGAVLLITAGMALLGSASELLELRRPSVQGLVLNALVYFLLGMVMLGQLRFIQLRRVWQKQRVEVSNDLADRWVRYSLAFIGLAALLAFLLPTGFVSNPFMAIADALSLVGGVLYFLVVLLFALITFPISLLYWLLAMLFGGAATSSRPRPEVPAFAPPAAVESGGATGWLEIVRALIFWVILVATLFYVIHSYLRDRPGLRDSLAAVRPIRALRWGWAVLGVWLKRWFTRFKHAVSERVPRRMPRGPLRDAMSVAGQIRYFRLGALSPRERVLYYYLSIVRRASRQGFPRRRHQTPHEYSTALKSNLPQAQEEMEALTQAFVEARYSEHEVAVDQDRRVRSYWERVKSALRALRRQQDSEG
jgi:hypothetical protein